jgi:hypothetical protein
VSAFKVFRHSAPVVRIDVLPSQVSRRLFGIRKCVLVIGEIMRKVRKGFQIEKCMITQKSCTHRNAAPVHRIEAMFLLCFVLNL